MTEPFIIPILGEPENAYFDTAPIDFKNPVETISLIPMTSRILTGDRAFYTKDEIENNKNILKEAYDNTNKNPLRRNTDNDFISVRSNKTGVPCTALFMSKNRERTFKALDININDFYIIFITMDEVMFAEKANYKPTQIKKIITNIKNKMSSLCPDGNPILSTKIFEYDAEVCRYIEV